MKVKQNLLTKYENTGFWKAGELLLKPHDALQLIQELEFQNIQIFGVDLWLCVQNNVVEDPNSLDFSTIQNPKDSLDIAKNFIQSKLPKKIAFVSFIL